MADAVERLLAVAEEQAARAGKLEERLSRLEPPEPRPAVLAAPDEHPGLTSMVRQAQLRAVNRAAVEAGTFGKVLQPQRSTEMRRGREARQGGDLAAEWSAAANKVEWKDGEGEHATSAKEESGTDVGHREKENDKDAASAEDREEGRQEKEGVELNEQQATTRDKDGRAGETVGSKAKKEAPSREDGGRPGQQAGRQVRGGRDLGQGGGSERRPAHTENFLTKEGPEPCEDAHTESKAEGRSKDVREEKRPVSDNDGKDERRLEGSKAREEGSVRQGDKGKPEQQAGKQVEEGGDSGQGDQPERRPARAEDFSTEEGAAPGEDVHTGSKAEDSGLDVGDEWAGQHSRGSPDTTAGTRELSSLAEAEAATRKAAKPSSAGPAVPCKAADEIFLRLCAAVAEVEGRLELEVFGSASLYAAHVADAGHELLEASAADQRLADWQTTAQEVATVLESLFEAAET